MGVPFLEAVKKCLLLGDGASGTQCSVNREPIFGAENSVEFIMRLPCPSDPSDHPDVDDAGPLTYLMHSVDAETGRANRVGRDGVMAGPDRSGVRHG